MSRWINQLLVAVLVIAAGGVGFWLGHDARPNAQASEAATAQVAEDAPVAAVQTQPLAVATIANVDEAYGTIQSAPGSSATITAPFDAVVQQVTATPGMTVAESAPLLTVGPTPEALLQLKQASDAVAAADRNVEDVRRRLTEQLATNAELLTAEQAQQTAKTQLASLQQRGVGEPRQITTSTAGTVDVVSVSVGQVVAAGAPLATIATNKEVEALIGLESSLAAKVKPGDAVTLRDIHAAADAPPTHGTVRLIAPQLNPQTRLRDVFVTLAAGESALPGTFVVARVETESQSGLAVPRSAVTPDDEDNVLFVVQDGKAVRRIVTITLTGRDSLLVASDDLHAGDAIVTDGNAELGDGMAVRVEPPKASTEPTTAPATSPEEK